jgi:hypothetical protein
MMCAECGVIANTVDRLPDEVASIVRGLAYDKLFNAGSGIEAIGCTQDSDMEYIIRLLRKSPIADKDQWYCIIRWRWLKPHCEPVARTAKDYRELNHVHMDVPRIINQAALSINDSGVPPHKMFVTESVLRGERRHIRFERTITGFARGGTLQIRVELGWSMPDTSGDTKVFVPVYDAKMAESILQNGWRNAFINEKLLLCPNRLSAQETARVNAPKGAKEVWIIAIHCNPMELGSALLTEESISVGKHHRWSSVKAWWKAEQNRMWNTRFYNAVRHVFDRAAELGSGQMTMEFMRL